MTKLKLFLPQTTNLNCHIGNWINNNLVEIQEYHCPYNLIWINSPNNILLWGADGLHDGHGNNLNNIKCNYKITMNEIIPGTIPSFYWSRDENKLMEFIENNKYLDYSQRKQNTIFLGSIKDNYQGKFRKTYDWSKYIDEFSCPSWNGEDKNYKYDQNGYYQALSHTRFGLCLRGGGPKCWRDIEYMALGTVLIVTDGVDTDGYHNPLVENIHYIKVTKPQDIQTKINAISEEKWNIMSTECQKWYNNNCRFDASIRVLEDICSSLY